MKGPSASGGFVWVVTMLCMPAWSWAQESADVVEAGAETGSDNWLDVSGFVDTSVVVPIDGFPTDSDAVVFGLDQVELDFIASPVGGLMVRADLNLFPSAGIAFDDNIVEQGLIEYIFGGDDTGVFISAGKRNAPIGIESIDPVDEYQFSNGQLFNFATPSNLTGFFTGYYGTMVSVMVWATNDWDTPSTPNDAIVGGRVEYHQDAGHVGVSSTYGPLGEDKNAQLMVDLDAMWTFGALSAFLEVNFGMLEDDPNALEEDPTSLGVLVKLYYAFENGMGVTARWDWLDRQYAMPPIKAMSVTGAYLFPIVDHFGGVVEIRADIPDEGDTTLFAAGELTAYF